MSEKLVKYKAPRPINHGGVMRCCFEALENEPPTPVDGEILTCPHCAGGWRLDGGEWVGKDAPPGYRGGRIMR